MNIYIIVAFVIVALLIINLYENINIIKKRIDELWSEISYSKKNDRIRQLEDKIENLENKLEELSNPKDYDFENL